jgi:hypothetical protein
MQHYSEILPDIATKVPDLTTYSRSESGSANLIVGNEIQTLIRIRTPHCEYSIVHVR